MTPRIGLVGAGTIARYHAAAVRKVFAGLDVPLTVTDTNRAAAEGFLVEHPEATAARSMDAMLASPAGPRDIVIIATPPSTHTALALAAVTAGRHVLLEKPFATTIGDARAVVAAAERHGVLVSVCSSRFAGLAATRQVGRQLSAGAIGVPYRMTHVARRQRMRSGIEYQPESPWFLDPKVAGGGILMDGGPYDMALLVETLQPTRVEVRHAWQACPATAADPDGLDRDRIETHVGATMVFDSADGVAVTVDYERAACTHGPESFTTSIEGSAGALAWDWMLPGVPGWTLSTDRDGEVVSKRHEAPDTDGLGPHDRPLAYLWRRLEGGQSPGPVNAAALFEFEILQAIYDVARTGAPRVVELA